MLSSALVAGLYDVCGLTVLHGASGSAPAVDARGDVAQSVGIECLHAADQHVHLVDEYEQQWHIGESLSFQSWCACFDVHAPTALLHRA